MISEPLAITLRVTQELDRLDVPYLIGGSLASAMYGEPRATLDADVIADLGTEHAVPLKRSGWQISRPSSGLFSKPVDFCVRV